MSILGAVLSGSYIGVVKDYLQKIFKHEAALFEHRENEFDVILRKTDGNIRIFIYSNKEKRLLREMSDKEAEKILTS
jgi:hypothetical protein